VIGCSLVPFLMSHVLNSIIRTHGRSEIISVVRPVLVMLVVVHLMHLLLVLLVNLGSRLLDYSATNIAPARWS
jgi:uncharacterized membrane protein YhhN